MHFLLSNDDGYQARGLQCLAMALAKLGDVTVVAPECDQSGVSHALTLNRPIRVNTAENGFIYVDGTPADCVHLAINGLLKTQPDLVLSGINAGANLGDDVLYSGTVAAAMEARFLDCPAVAISLASRDAVHFDTAVRATLKIVELCTSVPLQTGLLLNVNVPDIPWREVGKFEVTRLGSREQSKPVIRSEDERHGAVYWIGAVGKGKDAGPGTDLHAVEHNNISITPLHADLTQYSALEHITERVVIMGSD